MPGMGVTSTTAPRRRSPSPWNWAIRASPLSLEAGRSRLAYPRLYRTSAPRLSSVRIAPAKRGSYPMTVFRPNSPKAQVHRESRLPNSEPPSRRREAEAAASA